MNFKKSQIIISEITTIPKVLKMTSVSIFFIPKISKIPKTRITKISNYQKFKNS